MHLENGSANIQCHIKFLIVLKRSVPMPRYLRNAPHFTSLYSSYSHYSLILGNALDYLVLTVSMHFRIFVAFRFIRAWSKFFIDFCIRSKIGSTFPWLVHCHALRTEPTVYSTS